MDKVSQEEIRKGGDQGRRRWYQVIKWDNYRQRVGESSAGAERTVGMGENGGEAERGKGGKIKHKCDHSKSKFDIENEGEKLNREIKPVDVVQDKEWHVLAVQRVGRHTVEPVGGGMFQCLSVCVSLCVNLKIRV